MLQAPGAAEKLNVLGCRPPRPPQRGRLVCRADVKTRSLEQAVRVSFVASLYQWFQ